MLQVSGPSEPALQGILLTRVLEACRALQLPVVLQAPNAQERESWQEAFICNW